MLQLLGDLSAMCFNLYRKMQLVHCSKKQHSATTGSIIQPENITAIQINDRKPKENLYTFDITKNSSDNTEVLYFQRTAQENFCTSCKPFSIQSKQKATIAVHHIGYVGVSTESLQKPKSALSLQLLGYTLHC